MLDADLKTQLTTYLQHLRRPVELLASLDDGAASRDLRAFLDELDGLHPQLRVRIDGQAERRPSFALRADGQDLGLAFAAVPLGHEFTSFVLALLHAGGHPPKADAALLAQIAALEPDEDLVFETWMSLSCHNCPEVVQALNLMAVLNPKVRHTAIDGALFAEEGERRQILAVPMVFLNGQPFGSGRMDLAQILAKADTGSAQREARRLSEQPRYDMLIVGGGPAGATAAVYAARKGIRTGVLAERIGGQTLDTLGIENYPSVLATEGPQFAAALEAQMRANAVELVAGQRVAALEPARQAGDDIVLTTESGATLRTRSLVLAPGARWRKVGVPGEDAYATRGVAYCPHCDGPLFKGKKVAVIGGGNSGVEAAIDLAGIVEHVSVVEFAEQLKADAVLVDKLRSLPNVDVHLNARTTEIVGDGNKVTGLRFEDRASSKAHELELAGVFVQIGLVPNTEFLEGVVELNRFGEIQVDARGATSVPGVFAAGDATTVPFKQIVIAAGEGAKAALAAFDHLIRTPAAKPAKLAERASTTAPATALA